MRLAEVSVRSKACHGHVEGVQTVLERVLVAQKVFLESLLVSLEGRLGNFHLFLDLVGPSDTRPPVNTMRS